MSEKSTPQLILDKAIDLSVNLTGSGFPHQHLSFQKFRKSSGR